MENMKAWKWDPSALSWTLECTEYSVILSSLRAERLKKVPERWESVMDRKMQVM